MKKNNKGVTIIEMIVSLALISLVLIFLMRLLLTVKDMDDKSLSMLEYQVQTSIIIKKIENTIKDNNNCTFDNQGNDLVITCDSPNASYSYTYNRRTLNGNQLMVSASPHKVSIINCLDGNIEGSNLNCPTDSWDFAEADVSSIISGAPQNDHLLLATINVVDDKNNTYPIEISYYKK